MKKKLKFKIKLTFILLKVLKIPYPYFQEKKYSLILRIILSVCLENQDKNLKEEKKYFSSVRVMEI